MFGQVCFAIITLLFLFGSGSILFSIFLEKDHADKYASLTQKNTKVKNAKLYFNDVE